MGVTSHKTQAARLGAVQVVLCGKWNSLHKTQAARLGAVQVVLCKTINRENPLQNGPFGGRFHVGDEGRGTEEFDPFILFPFPH